MTQLHVNINDVFFFLWTTVLWSTGLGLEYYNTVYIFGWQVDTGVVVQLCTVVNANPACLSHLPHKCGCADSGHHPFVAGFWLLQTDAL